MIAAVLVARFSGRTAPEICALGVISVDDSTGSAAYLELIGLGLEQGPREGRQSEAAALPLSTLEALADAP